MPEKSPEVLAYFADFAKASGLEDTIFSVVAFGDSPAMADELAALVEAGAKRATAGLAQDFGPGKDPLPRPGDHVVVVDGAGRPRCVWRTTGVEVKPLDAVDDRFAFDEGEGDRTRAWWLEAHLEFFTRQATTEGFTMHDRILTVFERFTVVWPPGIADQSGA